MAMLLQWQPAIYEHKAALIGKSPCEIAGSSEYLYQAVLREYETYRADFITIGVDVYNIEAEAVGAQLTCLGGNECPDVAAPVFQLDTLRDNFSLPEIPSAGRFRVLLETGRRVRAVLGDSTRIRVAASGPVSIAAKLAGFDNLLISLWTEDGKAESLLDFCTLIAEKWCTVLRNSGLDVIMFDSMAAPPLFSPEMYERFVLPRHRHLMELLQQSGQNERELVIGGDTTVIAGLLSRTGATILLCDFAAEAESFKMRLGNDCAIRIRRNINPAILQNADITVAARKFYQELCLFSNPIAGTGILPYDFVPGRYFDFKAQVEKLAASNFSLIAG